MRNPHYCVLHIFKFLMCWILLWLLAVSLLSETGTPLSLSHCSSCTGLFVAKSVHHTFSFLGKGPELEENILGSGGLRDCFLCRTHTHLCCLYKQRLRRLTGSTTIHRKLRGLTVSPGNLWSRWESAMTATLSCSPQCIHSCCLQMYFPWQYTNTHTKRRTENCRNNARHFNSCAIFLQSRKNNRSYKIDNHMSSWFKLDN